MWLVISEGGEGGGGHAKTAKASIPITHASAHDSLQNNPLNCSPTVKPRPRCNGKKKSQERNTTDFSTCSDETGPQTAVVYPRDVHA